MTTGAARKSNSRSTWELVLILALIAGSCLGAWAASHSLPFVFVTTFAVLAALIALTPGGTDLQMGGLGFSFGLKRES